MASYVDNPGVKQTVFYIYRYFITDYSLNLDVHPYIGMLYKLWRLFNFIKHYENIFMIVNKIHNIWDEYIHLLERDKRWQETIITHCFEIHEINYV